MNTTTRGISPLRQRMIEEMRMRQLAPKTREAYIRAVAALHPISAPLARHRHG